MLRVSVRDEDVVTLLKGSHDTHRLRIIHTQTKGGGGCRISTYKDFVRQSTQILSTSCVLCIDGHNYLISNRVNTWASVNDLHFGLVWRGFHQGLHKVFVGL